MKPTIGRVVIFTYDDQTARIAGGNAHKDSEVPAIIVAVWSEDCVNLKVITDSERNLWVTSVLKKNEGITERCWDWPTIVK